MLELLTQEKIIDLALNILFSAGSINLIANLITINIKESKYRNYNRVIRGLIDLLNKLSLNVKENKNASDF